MQQMQHMVYCATTSKRRTFATKFRCIGFQERFARHSKTGNSVHVSNSIINLTERMVRSTNDKKSMKKTLLAIVAILAATACLSSCGLSNMTEGEAYDAGYAIGRMLSN